MPPKWVASFLVLWNAVAVNNATAYACINNGDAVCSESIKAQAICIDNDIASVFTDIQKTQ